MNLRMKPLMILLASLVLTSAVVNAQSGSPSRNLPTTQMKFSASGVKDAAGRELLVSPAYGDLGKGPHGTFIRMPAGFSSVTHIHTGDYWGVVIAGVAANGKPGAPDVALPAGSYWFQKGGEDHVTKCISGNECLFFVSQTGPFDYVASKEGK